MHSYIFILLCAIFPMCLTMQIPLLERSPTRVQKSRVSTHLNVVKFEFEWIIENISLFFTTNNRRRYNIIFKSPPFSMVTSTDTYIWSLTIRYDDNNDNIATYLDLESGDISSVLSTTFVVYGLDENLNEIILGNYKASNYDKRERYNEFYYIGSLSKLNNNAVKNDTITILLKGESTIATKFGDTLNRYKFLDQNANLTLDTLVEADLDREMLEEILHFMYTKQPSNWMKMQEGILWAGDKFGLKLLFEEQLMSKLNIENAAEIYKFTYMHGQTDLKHLTMEFIKKNGADVMATKGWLSMLQSADTQMLVEIFSAFVNKQPIKDSSSSSEFLQVLIATEHTPEEEPIIA